VLPVQRTALGAADPVFSELPDAFVALQWHSDTYDLPDGAVQLARSDAYEQQAFRINRAYGIQFHVEVTSELGAQWGEVLPYASSLEALKGPGALPQLLEQVDAHADEMTGLARRMFAAWLERVVELD
jgi:GMP synthase-like glutamine amidotransferase